LDGIASKKLTASYRSGLSKTWIKVKNPATLLRTYAKRTKKADRSAAAIIGSISKSILG